MSTHRTVTFEPQRRGMGWYSTIPERERVAKILAGYFGQGATLEAQRNVQGGYCWVFSLPGQSSHEIDWFIFRWIKVPTESEEMHRRIEVTIADEVRGSEYPIGTMTVTTRGQDPFTVALADGLARAIARHTNGRIIDTND